MLAHHAYDPLPNSSPPDKVVGFSSSKQSYQARELHSEQLSLLSFTVVPAPLRPGCLRLYLLGDDMLHLHELQRTGRQGSPGSGMASITEVPHSAA